MSEKANILIVDDEMGPRESLRMVLKSFYTVYTAENGEKALEVLRNHPIDLVTLDLRMPGLSGTETLRELKALKEDLEVIIITGFGTLKTAMDGIRYGAADYLLKPFDITELLSIIHRTLSRKKLNDRLNRFTHELGKLLDVQTDLTGIKKILHEQTDFTERVKEIIEHSLFDETVHPEQRPLIFARNLVEFMEEDRSYTASHSKRVAQYSHLIGQQLQLNPEQLNDLELGAYLHDIGAVGLEPPTRDHEGSHVQPDGKKLKRHTEIGSDLITPLGFSSDVINIIRHHHEHYDGSGSPHVLKGEAIPLLARIVAVAESFDEMVSSLRDHSGTGLEGLAAQLKQGAGTQFDPKLIEVFLQIIKERGEGWILEFMGSKAEV